MESTYNYIQLAILVFHIFQLGLLVFHIFLAYEYK